jgi:hypothetical protein
MNRERPLTGRAGYGRELRLDVLTELTTRAGSPGSASAGGGARKVRWLDLCSGSGKAPAELRRQGFGYDAARRLVSRRGAGSVRFPCRYLGADDQVGPNYTGQPAVGSFYQAACETG